MRYLSFLVLLTLFNCASTDVKREFEETGYQTSGVEQFFLPELPAWSNFSTNGQCFKSTSVSYLNFKKILDAYQLKYDEMIELQGQYNARVENYYRSTAVKFLKPVEEASFFSNSLEQVRGGVRSFKLPNVTSVDVIWLDSFISKNKIVELKTMIQAGKFDERLPILFSSCLTRQGIQQWIIENNLEDAGFYTLGTEWLSPFDSDGNPIPGLRLSLVHFFGAHVKYQIISSQGLGRPSELAQAE